MIQEQVLDASALLALIFREPGADQVSAVLDSAMIHVVNYAETLRKMALKGVPLQDAATLLSALHLNVIEELSVPQASVMAQIALDFKHLGLSLGDCACLMLAQWTQCPVITADRRWPDISEPVVQVIQIR